MCPVHFPEPCPTLPRAERVRCRRHKLMMQRADKDLRLYFRWLEKQAQQEKARAA